MQLPGMTINWNELWFIRRIKYALYCMAADSSFQKIQAYKFVRPSIRSFILVYLIFECPWLTLYESINLKLNLLYIIEFCIHLLGIHDHCTKRSIDFWIDSRSRLIPDDDNSSAGCLCFNNTSRNTVRDFFTQNRYIFKLYSTFPKMSLTSLC